MAKPRSGVTQGRQRRAGRAPNQLSDVREAALSLFARARVPLHRVRDIADALGIGATSVYSHVRSKGELLPRHRDRHDGRGPAQPGGRDRE